MLCTALCFFLSFAILARAWDGDNPESVKEYIIYSAQHEGIDVLKALAIAQCESGFNRNALHQSNKEYSVGIFQINLKVHHDITEEEARNPFLNVNWAMEQMISSGFSAWTCAKMV